MQHPRNDLSCTPLSELTSTVVDRIPILLEQLQNLDAEEAFLDTKILLLQELHRRSASNSMDAIKTQPGTSVAESTLKRRYQMTDETSRRDISGTDSSSSPIASFQSRRRGIIRTLEDSSDTVSRRGRYD